MHQIDQEKHSETLDYSVTRVKTMSGLKLSGKATLGLQESTIPEGSSTQSKEDSDLTTNIVQVMPDNTTVIIKKGPGGSIQISKIGAEAPASTANSGLFFTLPFACL